jgi:hypothetical protein
VRGNHGAKKVEARAINRAVGCLNPAKSCVYSPQRNPIREKHWVRQCRVEALENTTTATATATTTTTPSSSITTNTTTATAATSFTVAIAAVNGSAACGRGPPVLDKRLCKERRPLATVVPQAWGSPALLEEVSHDVVKLGQRWQQPAGPARARHHVRSNNEKRVQRARNVSHVPASARGGGVRCRSM